MEIIVSHDKTSTEPVVHVPAEYFGAMFLRQIQDTLKGGHQRLVGISLGYPSLTAWDGEDSAAKGDAYKLVIVRRGYAESAKGTFSSYSKYMNNHGDTGYGLDEYRGKPGRADPNGKEIIAEIYGCPPIPVKRLIVFISSVTRHAANPWAIVN